MLEAYTWTWIPISAIDWRMGKHFERILKRAIRTPIYEVGTSSEAVWTRR